MLTERLTNMLVSEEIISNEEKEIVRFGLESICGNLVGMVLTMVIGICFKHIGEAVFLWLLLFPLRKNAGGFHASTKTHCFITSIIL